MVRKFKHQKTNAIAQQTKWGNYSLDGTDVHHISLPPDYIENSNDWVEINQEPVLVTEDGYQLNYRDKYFMVGESFKVEEKRLSEGTLFSSAAKRFYYRENAEAYIETHKPRYSNEDLENLKQLIKQENEDVFDGSNEYSEGVIDAFNKAERLIHKLKASKND